MRDKKKITLGSGYLFVIEYNGTIPEDHEIEIEDNRLAYIQSGATLTYTPTFYEAKDDCGDVAEEFLVDEEAILRSGLMTWTGDTLGKICSTARVTEDGGKRTVKIGGIGNHNHKKYLLRFVHCSGNFRITIAGSNQSGLELAFTKDAETVIDAEFKAIANLDENGTKIIYEETILPEGGSAELASLSFGKMALSPSFSPSVTSYTATTSYQSNKVSAVAASPTATIEIKLDSTPIENYSSICWQSGSNALTIKVTDGGADKTYTITVSA